MAPVTLAPVAPAADAAPAAKAKRNRGKNKVVAALSACSKYPNPNFWLPDTLHAAPIPLDNEHKNGEREDKFFAQKINEMQGMLVELLNYKSKTRSP